MTLLSAFVDAFVPNITCEIPKSTIFMTDTDEGPLVQMKLDTPTCSVGSGKFNDDIIYISDVVAVPINNVSCHGDCLPYPTSHIMQRVDCSNGAPNATALPADSPSHDFRFALIAANITNDAIFQGDVLMSWNRTVIASSAALCKIDYSLKKSTLTSDLVANTLSVSIDDPQNQGDHLPDLTSIQLSELIFSSLCEYGDISGLPAADSKASYPMFQILTEQLDGQKSLDRFFDSVTLQTTASEALKGISSQLIHRAFLKSANLAADGTGIYVEDIPSHHVGR